MVGYAVKRCLQAVPVLVGVSLVVFLLLHMIPGDVARALLGPTATEASLAVLREDLGLDQPLYVQYWRWLTRAVRADLGMSIEHQAPVSKLLRPRLKNTLILGLTSLTLSTVVGVGVGLVSALRPRSLFDRVSMVAALFGNSMPAFWIGLMILLLFSHRLGWFPTGGMYNPRLSERTPSDLAHHLVLPALTLGSLSVAIFARLTRSCLLEVLGQEYIRTARAKGLAKRRVILVHALRNALLPIVTMVGLQFGIMLGGAVLTETVFAWPGLGRQIFSSIRTRDLPMIQGSILLIALGCILINLVVDILYAYLDPRIGHN